MQTPTYSPRLREAPEQLIPASLRMQLAEEFPGEGVLVALVKTEFITHPSGMTWVIIEDVRRNTALRGKPKQARVRTVTGEDAWNEVAGDGCWFPTAYRSVFPHNLEHVQVVKDGYITEYLGKPYGAGTLIPAPEILAVELRSNSVSSPEANGVFV